MVKKSGSKSIIHISHCITEYGDYHQIATVDQIRPELDAELLNLGVKIKFDSISGGKKEKNPLMPDKEYIISYLGKNEERIEAKLRFNVKSMVWFDSEKINEHHNHDKVQNNDDMIEKDNNEGNEIVKEKSEEINGENKMKNGHKEELNDSDNNSEHKKKRKKKLK